MNSPSKEGLPQDPGGFMPGQRLELSDGEIVLFEGRARSRIRVRRIAGGDTFTIDPGEVVGVRTSLPMTFWEAFNTLATGRGNLGDLEALIAGLKVRGKHLPLRSWGSLRAIPYLYQYTPLFALRRSPWGRILVADETGLGKTVEAGIILHELFESSVPGDGIRDALVVAPISQWPEWSAKFERHFRFRRPLSLIDAKVLKERLVSKREPEKDQELHFLSMDALPSLLKEEVFLKAGVRPSQLYDLVIVDEAHHFKNESSKRMRGLELLLGNPLPEPDDDRVSEDLEVEPRPVPKLLLLTATPLSTDLRNLLSYFTLLDPGLMQLGGMERREAAFRQEHRRVVQARRLGNLVIRLLERPDETEGRAMALDVLTASECGLEREADEDFRDAREGLRTIRAWLEAPGSVEPEDLAGALLDIDPWSDLIVRNTRRGVGLHGATRITVRNHPVALSPGEASLVRKVPFDAHPFAQISFRQQLASSIPAFHNRRLLGVGGREILEDLRWEEEIEDPMLPGLEDLEVALDEVEMTSVEQLLSFRDSKYAKLLEQVRRFFHEEGQSAGLLFTRFTATAKYLHLRLGGDCGEVRMFYMDGKVPPDQRARLLQDAKEAHLGGQRVLLVLTEVGQEGIDLQFATGVFHYDLPWNPMRIIQRNGRVHRIGQTAPEIFIHTFFVEHGLDDRIAQAIARRMQAVYDTFGDLPEGLIGLSPSSELTDLIGEAIDWSVYAGLAGQRIPDLEARIVHDSDMLDRQTDVILGVHRERVHHLIEREAEACRAWEPLLKEALHGSRGSIERVLKRDLEALLRWGDGSQTLGLSAQPEPGTSAEVWDIGFHGYELPEAIEGMITRRARRELMAAGGMRAYLLPDEGGRRPDFETHQVLHLAHPLVMDLADRVASEGGFPIRFARSAAIGRPLCLVSAQFSLEVRGEVRRESRWFLLERSDRWSPARSRASLGLLTEALGRLCPWSPTPDGDPELLARELREALYEIQEDIREEEVARRRRLMLQRNQRAMRQWRLLLTHREEDAAERQDRLVGFMSYRDWRLLELERSRDPDPELTLRREETKLRSQATRTRNLLERTRARVGALEAEAAQIGSSAFEEVRVALQDASPLAVVVIGPEVHGEAG